MVDWFMKFFEMEYWLGTINQISSLGIFAGVGLAMLESFFPPLPLFIFVTINVFAFGFWKGYLYSWIGTCIGSIIIFFLIKRFGQRRFENMISNSNRIYSIFYWIRLKGFIPIFFLLTFPFTPSIVVCGLAGLANIKNKEYITALLLGKMIMVLSLSFIGYNVKAFFDKPLTSLIFIFISLGVSVIGKKGLQMYEKNIIRANQNQMEEQTDKHKVVNAEPT